LHVDLLVASVIAFSAASVMITHNWCTLLETPLLLLAISLDLSSAPSTMVSCPISSGSFNFPYKFSVAVKLTGEFASLEEPTDDPDVVILSTLPADGTDFVESERRVVPGGPI
jgi:hypothetical protein